MVEREARMLIGGKLVPARPRAPRSTTSNPATEEVLGVAADGSATDMDAAIDAARRAFDETTWSTDVAFRVHCLRQLHESLLRHAEELRGTVVAEAGSPGRPHDHGAARHADRGRRGGWPTSLERYEWAERPRREGAVRHPEPPHRLPRGRRRRRRHHAVELPDADQPGARSCLRWPPATRSCSSRRPTRRGRATVARPARRRGDRHPRRRPQRRHLLRPRRRPAAGRGRPRRPGVVHGLDGDGPQGHGGRGREPQEGLPRARWEVRRRRARRRRRRRGLGRRRLRGDDPRRPGLRHHHPPRRPPVALRRGRGGRRRSHGRPPVRRPHRPRPPDGSPDLGAPARARARLHRDREGRGGDRGSGGRGAGAPRRRASTSSRRSSSTSTPARPSPRRRSSGPCWSCSPTMATTTPSPSPTARGTGSPGSVHGSPARARAVAARMRTGTIAVNGAQWFGPDVPFGGYKQSGLGREMGVLGFEEYTEVKSVGEPP